MTNLHTIEIYYVVVFSVYAGVLESSRSVDCFGGGKAATIVRCSYRHVTYRD